jgi:apolipoprotein N-acyltransferase
MYAGYDRAEANLLVVMSNDAWFDNTPLQTHHFAITRIAAVMMGRDVVVNSNRGIVGLIRGNGAIEALPPSHTARTVKCVAHLSSKTTLYATARYFTFPLYALLACLSIVIRRK